MIDVNTGTIGNECPRRRQCSAARTGHGSATSFLYELDLLLEYASRELEHDVTSDRPNVRRLICEDNRWSATSE